jgi:hypothetical protein
LIHVFLLSPIPCSFLFISFIVIRLILGTNFLTLLKGPSVHDLALSMLL